MKSQLYEDQAKNIDSMRGQCPVIANYMYQLNARFNDKHQNLLEPFVPLLRNTKTILETELIRHKFIMWRNVTAIYPMILDSIDFSEIASTLRAFKNTIYDMSLANIFLTEKKEEVKVNPDPSYVYNNAHFDAAMNAYHLSIDKTETSLYHESYLDVYTNGVWLRQKLAELSIETLQLTMGLNKWIKEKK